MKNNNSLAKYWINIDEFINEFKGQLNPLLLGKLKEKLSIFKNSEEFLREIQDIFPEEYFKYIAKKINDFVNKKYSGEQHVDGIREDVPPLKGDFDVIWKSPGAISLTDVQIETTGWKPKDAYSLKVNHYIKDKDGQILSKREKHLFMRVPFKELGEHKDFSIFYNHFDKKNCKVKLDDELIFTIHNGSGNSRQLYLNIEYLLLGKGIPAAGPTALFLDVSGSMNNTLAQMATLMSKFLVNLEYADKVTICFVADRTGECKKGTYDFKRKDFSSKDDAIKFISDIKNIPHFGGGAYDIVTIQSAIDYNMIDFDNYIFCTDQTLEQYSNSQFLKDRINNFFENKEVYTMPVDDENKSYWQNVYKNMKLFKPLDLH